MLLPGGGGGEGGTESRRLESSGASCERGWESMRVYYLYQFNGRTNSGTLTAGVRTYGLVILVWTAIL